MQNVACINTTVFKQSDDKIGKTDMTDLQKDPVLRFQDKYYGVLALLSGFIIPILICGYGWGDFWGGFYFAACLKTVVLMQATFCINSLAHYYGESTFSDQRSPRDSYVVSLITFGEGFHNFHHEFPYDYRNGVKSYAYDPGKWLIYLLSLFGFTYNLKRFPHNEIMKGELQMLEKKLNQRKANVNYGPDPQTLPEYSWEQLISRSAEGSRLIVVDGIVHDVAEFQNTHPGGKKILEFFIGKDATNAFNGDVYNHSFAARNLLSLLRVGRMETKKSN